MRKLVLVSALTIGLASTGCVTIGHFNKANTTQVDLSGDNFTIVKSNIQGSDTGTRIIGLGLSPSHAKAMAQLRKKAGLEGTRRALVNITEERQIFSILVYSTSTLILTADVVEFGDGSSTPVASTMTTPDPDPVPMGGPDTPTPYGDATEPASAESLLRQYVARHNIARETGSFADLVTLFENDGRIIFKGVYEGRLNGRKEIQKAFEQYPPKDSLKVIRIKPTTSGAIASYAYMSAPDDPIGKLAVRTHEGLIQQLVIQRDK